MTNPQIALCEWVSKLNSMQLKYNIHTSTHYARCSWRGVCETYAFWPMFIPWLLCVAYFSL